MPELERDFGIGCPGDAERRPGDQLVAGAPLGVAAAAVPEITLELRRDGEPVNPLLFAG